MSGVLDSFTPGNSFAGIEFWVQQGGDKASYDFGVEVAVHRDDVPYSDGVAVVQLLGYTERIPALRCVVKAGDVEALRAKAKARTTGVLQILANPPRTCALTGVTDKRDFAQGYSYVTLAFEA